jgi:hypothetical protein
VGLEVRAPDVSRAENERKSARSITLSLRSHYAPIILPGAAAPGSRIARRPLGVKRVRNSYLG